MGSAFMSISITAKPLSVEVFSLGHQVSMNSAALHPLPNNTEVKLYDVAYFQILQQGLSQAMIDAVILSDEQERMEAAHHWIKAHDLEYQQIANIIQAANEDNINEVPAVVFNHQSIVLGTTDVNLAYQYFLNNESDSHA